MVLEGAVRIAVVEDSAAELSELVAFVEGYCSAHGFAARITAFRTGEALLRATAAETFDLLFIDILLPGISGIEAAKQLRESDSDALIVFITASPDFRAEGFGVWASGYVLKPVTSQDLARAMHACRFVLERASRIIVLPGPRGTDIHLATAELVYAEVYYKRTVLHTVRGELRTRVPLDRLERQLGGPQFLRCNRSFVVNLHHVDDVLDDDLLMLGGDRVPIRRRNRKEIKLAVARFIAGAPAPVS